MDLINPIRIPQNNGEMAQYGTDEGLFVEFYQEPMEMEFKSLEAGHKIYLDVEMIRIQPRGQNQTVVVQKVEELHKRRFPRQYAQFKEQELQVSEGMPITEWAPIGKSQALELKGLGIHTVEDLATVPDAAVINMMGGMKLREQARTWMAQATDGAAILKLKAQNEQLLADMQSLKDQVKNLTGKEIEPENKPRRGRKPKNADES